MILGIKVVGSRERFLGEGSMEIGGEPSQKIILHDPRAAIYEIYG